jgi:hypothetical protein
MRTGLLDSFFEVFVCIIKRIPKDQIAVCLNLILAPDRKSAEWLNFLVAVIEIIRQYRHR